MLLKLKWIQCPNRICFQARIGKMNNIKTKSEKKDLGINQTTVRQKSPWKLFIVEFLRYRMFLEKKSDWFGGFFAQRWNIKNSGSDKLRLQCSRPLAISGGIKSHNNPLLKSLTGASPPHSRSRKGASETHGKRYPAIPPGALMSERGIIAPAKWSTTCFKLDFTYSYSASSSEAHSTASIDQITAIRIIPAFVGVLWRGGSRLLLLLLLLMMMMMLLLCEQELGNHVAVAGVAVTCPGVASGIDVSVRKKDDKWLVK